MLGVGSSHLWFNCDVSAAQVWEPKAVKMFVNSQSWMPRAGYFSSLMPITAWACLQTWPLLVAWWLPPLTASQENIGKSRDHILWTSPSPLFFAMPWGLWDLSSPVIELQPQQWKLRILTQHHQETPWTSVLINKKIYPYPYTHTHMPLPDILSHLMGQKCSMLFSHQSLIKKTEFLWLVRGNRQL